MTTFYALHRPTTLGGGNFTLSIEHSRGDVTATVGRYLVTSSACARALLPVGSVLKVKAKDRRPGAVVAIWAPRRTS